MPKPGSLNFPGEQNTTRNMRSFMFCVQGCLTDVNKRCMLQGIKTKCGLLTALLL